MNSIESPGDVQRLIVHQFDPGRPSPGGIDTCLRGLCRYAPVDTELAFIGVDTGQVPGRRLGVWERFQFGDRYIWFLPVARLDPADQKRRVPHSLRLAFGLMRHRRAIPKTAAVQAHRMDIAWVLKKIFKTPLIYFVHTQDGGLTGATSDSLWKLAGKLHKKLEHSVVSGASEVVVFNEDYAEKLHNINHKTVFSPTWFDPALVGAEVRERKLRTIIWVGRFEKPKDPILAIDSFCELLRAEPEAGWTLTMAGDGTLMDEAIRHLKSLAEQYSDQIKILGRVHPAEVATLMSASSHFLMTSYPGYEGYPRVLVESMASGLISIVTSGSDTGSLVADGINGYTALNRSASEIADLIRKSEGLSSEQARQTVSELSAPVVVNKIFNNGQIESLNNQQAVNRINRGGTA